MGVIIIKVLVPSMFLLGVSIMLGFRRSLKNLAKNYLNSQFYEKIDKYHKTNLKAGLKDMRKNQSRLIKLQKGIIKKFF